MKVMALGVFQKSLIFLNGGFDGRVFLEFRKAICLVYYMDLVCLDIVDAVGICSGKPQNFPSLKTTSSSRYGGEYL